MSVEDVFRAMQASLDRAGVPYMLTGSFASSIHGEPRASKDIDIVIAPTRDQLVAFMRQFPNEQYYAVEEDALEALEQAGMFNIIDFGTGWKIDLICRKDRPFSEMEFARRREQDLAGLRLFVATAEDVVISKLEWVKIGESQRQLQDAVGIIRVKGEMLDISYIEHWVRELGLEEQWAAAKAQTG